MGRDGNPHLLNEDFQRDSEILRKVHSVYTSSRHIDFQLLSKVGDLRRLFNEYVYLIYLELQREQPETSVIESIFQEMEQTIPLSALDTTEPYLDFETDTLGSGVVWNRFYSLEFLGEICISLLKTNLKIDPILDRANSEEEKLLFFEILCYNMETQEISTEKFNQRKAILDSKLEVLYFHANRLSNFSGGIECLNALAMVTNKLDRLLISGIIYTELLTRLEYVKEEDEYVDFISLIMSSLTLMERDEPFNKILFQFIDQMEGFKNPTSFSPILSELEFGLRRNSKLTISESNFNYLLLLVRLNYNPPETMKNLTSLSSLRGSRESQFLLEEALDLYPELEGLLLDEDPLLYIAEVAMKMGDADFAYGICDKIAEYCKDIEEIETRADEYTALGSILLQFELLNKDYGLKFIRSALELVRDRDEILFKGNFLFKITIILWNAGQVESLKFEIREVLDEVLKRGISGNLSPELKTAETLCIAECLMILGEDRSSLDIFKATIADSISSLRESTHAMLVGNTCKTFLNFGSFENSVELLLLILENSEGITDKKVKTSLILDFLDTLLNSYKIEVNLPYCKELLKIVKTFEDPIFRSRAYFLMAEKMKQLGELELSEELLTEGI